MNRARPPASQGWRVARLGELLERIDAGVSPKALDRPARGGELGVLKVSAVTWNEFRPEENKALPENFDADGYPRVRRGDLLLSRANTAELLASPVLVQDDHPNLLLSDKTLRLVANAKVAHAPYLLHALRTWSVRRYFASHATGTSGSMRNVSQVTISACPIPLPPLSEQRRIAEVLDRTEALRVKRRAALAKLDTLTQAIFLDLFGDPIQNPRKFPVRPMIELVDPERPISYGILKPGPDQADGVKYVRVVDMKDGGVDIARVRKTTEKISNEFRRSLLKTDDLLLSIRGHVGRLAIVPSDLHGANITQDTARLALRGVTPIFARECLRTHSFQRWMTRYTKGVAVRGINLGDVKLMPLITPERDLQDLFTRQATLIERTKTAQRASLDKLDALFASLQHRAFRGEL